MTTLTVREVRYQFAAVLDRVAAGEEFEISRRGKIVARLAAAKRSGTKRNKLQLPDYEARMKRIFGDKELPYNPVLKMREEDERAWERP